MRVLIIILVGCLLVVGAGAFSYFLSSSHLTPNSSPTTTTTERTIPFTELAHGTRAQVTKRTNYMTTTPEGFQQLWTMAYGDHAPTLPEVDFSKYYVIAVFAGTEPTGGYAVSVARITDTSENRLVSVSLVRPGTNCVTSQTTTAPFQFVTVPISEMPITHADIESVSTCK